MIQAPQTQQYIPQQLVPAGYQGNGAYPPVQQQMAPPPQGAIYNYPTASSYPPAQIQNQQNITDTYNTHVQNQNHQKFNGVKLNIKNPQGQGDAQTQGCGNNGEQVQSQSGVEYNGVYINITNPQGQGLGNNQKNNLMPAQFYPAQMLNQPPFIQNVPSEQQIQSTVYNNQQPVNNQLTTEPEVPAPQIKSPQNNEQLPAPVIDQPEQQASNVSPEAFAGRLKTDDLDAQEAALTELAEKFNNPEIDGYVLLDPQISDALVDIINKDTSLLQGPTPDILELRLKSPTELTPIELEKIAPTPLEKADENKMYALYTLSYMYDRLNKESEDKKGIIFPFKELPQVNKIVDVIESNPNPMLRIAGIAALANSKQPEYNDFLAPIFENAMNDEDDRVREAAVRAYGSLKVGPELYDNQTIEAGPVEYANTEEVNQAA